MKKIRSAAAVTVLVFSAGSFAGRPVFSETMDPDIRYEKLLKEAEKSSALLEIWKDHVRTVTNERNMALKEIEALKLVVAAPVAPMAQFGGVETQPLPSPQMAKQMEAMGAEVTRLRAELEQKSRAAVPVDASAQNGFKKRLEELESQNADLTKRLASDQAQMERSAKELADRKNQGDALTKFLQKELNDKKTQNEELSDRLADLTKTLQAEQQKGTQTSTLQGQIVTLKTQIAELTKALQAEQQKSAQSSTLQPQMASIQSQLEQSKKDLNDSTTQNNALKMQIAELTKTLQAEQQKGTQTSTLQGQIVTLKTQIAEMTKSLQTEKASGVSMIALQSENDHLKNELSAGNERIDAMVKNFRIEQEKNLRLSALENQVEVLTKDLEADKIRFEQSAKEASDVKAGNETLKGRIVELTKALQAEQQKSIEVSALRSQMAALQSQGGQSAKDLNDAKAKNDILKQQITGLTMALQSQQEKAAQISAIQTQFEQSKKEIEDSARVIAELRSQLSTTEEERDRSRQRALGLENSLKFREQKDRDFGARMEALQKSGDEAKAREEALSKQIAIYRENLKSNLKDITELRSKFASILDSLAVSFDERQK